MFCRAVCYNYSAKRERKWEDYLRSFFISLKISGIHCFGKIFCYTGIVLIES